MPPAYPNGDLAAGGVPAGGPLTVTDGAPRCRACAKLVRSPFASRGSPVADRPPNLVQLRRRARCSESQLAEVVAVAHESSEHAALTESVSLGVTTLEQLRDDVVRLARAYVGTPPLPVLRETSRVRNRAYLLLSRT
jgi:hypothetical protein